MSSVNYSLQEVSCQYKEERGSPCLTPLLQFMFFPGTPLRSTEVVAEERIYCTHLVHFALNPSCCIIWIMVVSSIVSKALVKSILRITISLLE
jgi:hypothetical protein